MRTYICVYFGSLALAAIVTPVVIFIARALNIYDKPGARKVHASAIPRIGGVAIFVSAITFVIAMLFLDNRIGERFRQMQTRVVVMLAASTFIFLIGLVDDLRGMRARYKLLAQFAAAMAVCLAGVRINLVSVEDLCIIRFGWFSFPVTVFWIVAITNAVNLIDGLDGLAAGISAITCAVIATFAFEHNQPFMAGLMLAILGSLSGFLFFNFNPARIFMGDGGSMFLGFTLACASVMSAAKSETIVALALPALALGVPIFDTLFSIVRRYLGRWGIMSADRNHLHHRLLDMGLRHHHVVIIMYVITALAAGLGMFMMIARGGGVVAIFFSVLLLLVLVFRVAGAVGLREIISRLKYNMVVSKEAKEHTHIFEETYLRFHEAMSFKQLWQAASAAAEEMGFLEVRLTATAQSGRSHKFIWKAVNNEDDQHEVVSIKLVLDEHRLGVPLDIEVKIPANGLLESAGRRMMLFGRLIDEYDNRNLLKETGKSILSLKVANVAEQFTKVS